MKYKVGDKVRVRKDLVPEQKYGKYFLEEPVLSLLGKVLTIQYVNSDDSYTMKEDSWSCWTDEMLEPVEKTLDNLEVDDVVIDEDDDERVVLAVCGRLIALSWYEDLDKFCAWYTVRELETENYKVKQSDADEVTELTLEEIADKFGKDVKKIKIKK